MTGGRGRHPGRYLLSSFPFLLLFLPSLLPSTSPSLPLSSSVSIPPSSCGRIVTRVFKPWTRVAKHSQGTEREQKGPSSLASKSTARISSEPGIWWLKYQQTCGRRVGGVWVSPVGFRMDIFFFIFLAGTRQKQQPGGGMGVGVNRWTCVFHAGLCSVQ